MFYNKYALRLDQNLEPLSNVCQFKNDDAILNDNEQQLVMMSIVSVFSLAIDTNNEITANISHGAP